jgi:hypothetical protein
MSDNLAGQDKWQEGTEVLARVVPNAQAFTDRERAYAKRTFMEFSAKLTEVNQAELAARFKSNADSLYVCENAILPAAIERGLPPPEEGM